MGPPSRQRERPVRNGERQATPVVSPDARPLDPVRAGQETGVAAGSGEGGDAPIGSFAVPALAAIACHEQGVALSTYTKPSRAFANTPLGTVPCGGSDGSPTRLKCLPASE